MRGVQVLSVPTPSMLEATRVELRAFVPATSSTAAIEGGFVLPGNIRKHVSAAPPEVRVSVADAGRLHLTLTCVQSSFAPTPPVHELEVVGEIAIWDLTELALVDGDYELVVYVDGCSEPESYLGRSVLIRKHACEASRCRPTRRPCSRACASRLVCRAEHRPTGYSPVPADVSCLPDATPDPVDVGWILQRRSDRDEASKTELIVLPPPRADQCVVTGAHYMVNPTVRPGSRGLILGRCKGCGLVKRYPARYRSSQSGRSALVPPPDLSALPVVRKEDRIDWRLGLDALSHIGGGPIRFLDRVAQQLETGGLFGDEFVRLLESLGHIEIVRDPRTGAPTSWRVATVAVGPAVRALALRRVPVGCRCRRS